MESNKISAKLRWWKQPNYLTFGRATSVLNIDEPKLSSMWTLRVELKERKCEIRWYKLCSSKLMITSFTRSDLSVISKWTLSCSFPRTFGFQNGRRLSGRAVAYSETETLRWSGKCGLATSTDYRNFFRSYHWCWKLKNYCEALNIAIVGSTRVLQ